MPAYIMSLSLSLRSYALLLVCIHCPPTRSRSLVVPQCRPWGTHCVLIPTAALRHCHINFLQPLGGTAESGSQTSQLLNAFDVMAAAAG